MKSTKELAEETVRKQLELTHGTLEEGMKVHGSKGFERMVTAVVGALEIHCGADEQ